MTTYNHMFDIAFSVSHSSFKDPDDIPVEHLREAITNRLYSLDDNELKEAVGFCDSYEEG